MTFPHVFREDTTHLELCIGCAVYVYEIGIPALGLKLCRSCLRRARSTLKSIEKGLPPVKRATATVPR